LVRHLSLAVDILELEQAGLKVELFSSGFFTYLPLAVDIFELERAGYERELFSFWFFTCHLL
jgi:hypothetical protein